MNHIDDKGRVSMVNVGDKPILSRHAVARAVIELQPATLELVLGDGVAKGDVLATARIAAINAAKRTWRRWTPIGRRAWKWRHFWRVVWRHSPSTICVRRWIKVCELPI